MNRFTPRGHVVDPHCPNDDDAGHGYHRAHWRGCKCPGDSLDAYLQAKTDDRERRKERDGVGRAAAQDQKHEARFPMVPGPTHEATPAERDFHDRDDHACKGMDLEMFFPVGTGPVARQQERAAKAVCHSCPAMQQCGREAFRRGEQHGIFGGLSEHERRAISRAQQQPAVAA